MTEAATIARDNASHCEVKKHALRQTQDGIVVAFVVHPNDVPPALQLAPLGTRYMLALVEIGEDEQPKAVAHDRKVTKEPAPDRDAPARAPRKWDEITPAQQAGIRCNEPAFVKFLNEMFQSQINETLGRKITTTADAEQFVRDYCEVESRRDIRDGVSLNLWKYLESQYRAWQLAPGMGAA